MQLSRTCIPLIRKKKVKYEYKTICLELRNGIRYKYNKIKFN